MDKDFQDANPEPDVPAAIRRRSTNVFGRLALALSLELHDGYSPDFHMLIQIQQCMQQQADDDSRYHFSNVQHI